jgi:pimeloyl-ACP methyl ester carboxylesterase
MGAYDIPAMIDFILKNTGEKTLSYMGHSQGTSQMFSALSENKDDIQKKINLFIAMAPVARLTHTRNNFLEEIANDIDELAWGFELFHIWSLFGSNWDTISRGICLLKDSWC